MVNKAILKAVFGRFFSILGICIWIFCDPAVAKNDGKDSDFLLDKGVDELIRFHRAETFDFVTIASKKRQHVNETPSFVSIVTAKEIENMGAKTLEEVLRQIISFDINPGFTVFRYLG